MFTKSLFLYVFLVISAATLNCPITNWTLYKSTEDDITGLYNIGYPQYEIDFTLNRTIMYKCFSNYTVQFKTSWTADAKGTDDFYNKRQRFISNVTNICNKQPACDNHIPLQIRMHKETRYWSEWNTKWSNWANKKLINRFFYLKKTCTKLYWTNWIETTNCETSPSITLKRSCADCDGDALEQMYCDATGHAVVENDCNHYWSNWTEGPCVTTGCNIAGERVKTRQCLYGDGSETNKVQLCSKSKASSVMKEDCMNYTIPDECEPQVLQGTSNWDNSGLSVGVGVAVALIVILSILLVIVRYRSLKSTHFPPNAKTNTNQTFPCKFANTAIKADEQSGDVTQPAEFSQQNPAEAYEFANPTTRANDRSFKSLKQAKQNAQENTSELEEEPVAYDIAQTDGSNANRFKQASNQDVFIIKTRGVSNAYEIAMQADPKVYEIEDPRLHAESNLPMAQSIEGEGELGNAYSSLQLSSDVVESMYSQLER